MVLFQGDFRHFLFETRLSAFPPLRSKSAMFAASFPPSHPAAPYGAPSLASRVPAATRKQVRGYAPSNDKAHAGERNQCSHAEL